MGNFSVTASRAGPLPLPASTGLNPGNRNVSGSKLDVGDRLEISEKAQNQANDSGANDLFEGLNARRIQLYNGVRRLASTTSIPIDGAAPEAGLSTEVESTLQGIYPSIGGDEPREIRTNGSANIALEEIPEPPPEIASTEVGESNRANTSPIKSQVQPGSGNSSVKLSNSLGDGSRATPRVSPATTPNLASNLETGPPSESPLSTGSGELREARQNLDQGLRLAKRELEGVQDNGDRLVAQAERNLSAAQASLERETAKSNRTKEQAFRQADLALGLAQQRYEQSVRSAEAERRAALATAQRQFDQVGRGLDASLNGQEPAVGLRGPSLAREPRESGLFDRNKEALDAAKRSAQQAFDAQVNEAKRELQAEKVAQIAKKRRAEAEEAGANLLAERELGQAEKRHDAVVGQVEDATADANREYRTREKDLNSEFEEAQVLNQEEIAATERRQLQAQKAYEFAQNETQKSSSSRESNALQHGGSGFDFSA